MTRTLIDDKVVVQWVIGLVRTAWTLLPEAKRYIYVQALLRVNDRLQACYALAESELVNQVMARMEYKTVVPWLFVSDHRLYPATAKGWTRFQREFKGYRLTGASLWNIYRIDSSKSEYFLATYKDPQPVDVMTVQLSTDQVTDTVTAVIVALYMMGRLPFYVEKWVTSLTYAHAKAAPDPALYVLEVMAKANPADKKDFSCETHVATYSSSSHLDCFFNHWLYPRTPEGLDRLMDDLEVVDRTIRAAVLSHYARYPQYVVWDKRNTDNVLVELSGSGLRPVGVTQDCYYNMARDYEAWRCKKGTWPDEGRTLKEVQFKDIFKEQA